MNIALIVIHALAGFIVLAEALNKLDRSAPLRRGLTPRQRVLEIMKAAAWSFLALGAGGAMVGPLMNVVPGSADACTMIGFAIIVIRSRLQEVQPGQPPAESDDFDRTRRIMRPMIEHGVGLAETIGDHK